MPVKTNGTDLNPSAIHNLVDTPVVSRKESYMTRQHFESLALFIGELAELNDFSNVKLDEAITLAENYFGGFNPNFDHKKFNQAVYYAADKFQEQFAV